MQDNEIKKILSEAKTIAVIGCSRSEGKPSHDIPKFLQSAGYKIIPVNPSADEILGEKAHKNILEAEQELEENKIIDIVDVFRLSEEVLGIVEDVIRMERKPKMAWMQLGIKNEEAKKLAESKGINVVMNSCLMVEYKRLFEGNATYSCKI